MSGFKMDDYVDVPARLRAFREKHPEGCLQPANVEKAYDIITVGDKTFVVYVACAYRSPDDVRPGVGVAWELFPGKTPYTRDSELMNAETSAWGRAILAALAADAKRIASTEEIKASGADRQAGADGPTLTSAPVSANKRDHLNARAAVLVADKQPVADTRMARNLPPINKSNAEQLDVWADLLSELEAKAAAVRKANGVATPIALGDVKNMSNIAVIQALKARGLSVEGTRDDLKVRLIGALEQEAPFTKEEIF